MRINHNIAALNTYRQLSSNSAMGSKSLEKLSSGLRINRAGDDAAGLAISEKMRAQIRGLDQAARNSQDAISLIQTAEGALNETHSILQRMRELANQAANGTNVEQDRSEIQREINQLTSEVNRIGNTTEFNTQKLLNGGAGQTGNIRYSVVTAGVAGVAATGDMSAVSTVISSVKAGTAAVSAVTKVTDSVASLVSATGAINAPFETTSSVVSGTGSIQLFRAEISSVKTADSGTIGSPFLVSTASVTAGTGAINKSTLVIGAGGATATYAIEITSNFTEGDQITVGALTLTAKSAGAGAGEFNIGTSITETRDNIFAAIDASSGGANAFIDGGVTYNLTKADPLWAGSSDDNLIVFTNAAGNAIDANAAAMAASAVTQVVAQPGVYKFEIATDFEVGQKITINGYDFSAVSAAGANTVTTFKIGADVEETATNLKAAMDLAKAAAAPEFANYNISIGAGGTVFADTITLTEAVASGTDLAAPTLTNISEVRGKFSFEIKDNFSLGDSIVVDGVTLTATAGANSGTTFQVGGNAAATAANLVAALNLSTLNTQYDVVAGAGTNGNNKITLTEKATQADGSDMIAPVVSKVAEQAGVYEFALVNNFTAGEKIAIDGQTFKAVASGAVAANGEFNVGATTDLTAASLKSALEANATTNAHYTFVLAGSDFTMTEKATQADGSAPVIGATSPVGETLGEYTVKLTTNASLGDKITIEGREFVGVSGAAAAGQFKVGANIGATTDNLIAAIKNDAVIGEAARFTATKVTDNTDPLNPVYTIKLTEMAGLANGDNTVTATATTVAEVRGIYTIDVDANFAAKDKLTIGGVTFTAGTANSATTFAVGADQAATAANITAAINLNATLKAHYVATTSGSSIALTEKAGQATGVALVAPTVDGDATQGQYNFGMSSLAAGSKVTIDGTELTIAIGGSESETASELKTLIDNDATLSANYNVTVSGSTVTLKQAAGAESSTKPTITYQTQAGSGFRSAMQIGTNSGQSLTIDMNDMRSLALDISSSAGASGETVTVDGKEYAIEWTSVNTVTNGTDNVATEYALDVSNHDNATAAVKVIDAAINSVSAERSKLGAFQNRLEHTINNLGTSSENLTASESRIRDVDMAKEMMEFTKNNILMQAAQAMLAQANQQPQGVLQLLR